MNWIEEKFIWLLGVFGVTVVGGIFSYGRLTQKVSQQDKDIQSLQENIKEVESDLSEMKSKQDEMIGYAKAIDKKLDQLLNK